MRALQPRLDKDFLCSFFRARLLAVCFFLATGSPLFAKVVVFWQPGFPTAASQPIQRDVLMHALAGMNPEFADIDSLRDPATLARADLLVLPYGSATPVDAWDAIRAYLAGGGNLLVLGGQPFRVPARKIQGAFQEERPQDTYARALGFPHSHEVPVPETATFAWKFGYTFLPALQISAQRFFAVEGRLDGLGYMLNNGAKVAAPVIVANRAMTARRVAGMHRSRAVLLDFEPKPGYWESPDGIALVRQAAAYAEEGAIEFSLETRFSSVQPKETPQIFVHLQRMHTGEPAVVQTGTITVEVVSGDTVLSTARLTSTGSKFDAAVPMQATFPPGFYTVRATYTVAGQPREFYQNGFWVSDGKSLDSGPVLAVKGDFITRDGHPFFPFGTNYFTTEENGWDFSGPRNAWVWDKDFAEMEQHGVSFVRTGVWMPNAKFVDPVTNEANERFLRNLEAYLLCAQRHHIVVNFTFFAFSPRSGPRAPKDYTAPIPNPYTDPAAVLAEQQYVLSVVDRFKNVPWLCWDLINEPSFSNPRKIFHGNIPNGDPTEVVAWQKWLQQKYGTLEALGAAWSVPPGELKSFDAIPLPKEADLKLQRYGDAKQVRALDYNLFAQATFTQWVHMMVSAIRNTGSQQLIDVGQDEGGVTNRVLNQFYAVAGDVSFTTNHTYWQDDALLWDSVVAKHPGMPNITGETGYQPAWLPDGTWRYDEQTGWPLMERKWALGFAAGASGALQWDWAREPDFGMQRSDGSEKIWETGMREMGRFAQQAAPWATGWVQPQTVLILPQSLQLSVLNGFALQAQQNAVRALYQYSRAEATVVGEYQIEEIGSPKLMILPSSFVLTSKAWGAITEKVRQGATLLISGPFDKDARFHATGRQDKIGLPYNDVPLRIREQQVAWPGGKLRLSYGGDKTTYLYQADLPNHKDWAEISLGKGKILFSSLPLELNDNLQAIGDVYRYALRDAGIMPTYTTTLQDAGILICPTKFPHATLYVLTSESNQQAVSFQDRRSGKLFSGTLAPGHAALLLIGDNGKKLAAYNWQSRKLQAKSGR